jgi:hypothetical protein
MSQVASDSSKKLVAADGPKRPGAAVMTAPGDSFASSVSMPLPLKNLQVEDGQSDDGKTERGVRLM